MQFTKRLPQKGSFFYVYTAWRRYEFLAMNQRILAADINYCNRRAFLPMPVMYTYLNAI
jgi:hypothetical protein